METIFYADLTPCDDMHNYHEAAFTPEFILDDTKHFDTEPPIGVIQVATRYGWCIVAKWGNNGSTRIYGRMVDAVVEGVAILHGKCDSGDCDYVMGKFLISQKDISDQDARVFLGRDIWDDFC